MNAISSARPRAALVAQWAGLLACSAAVTFLLELARLPAALLLGPMLSGIAFGAAGATLTMSRLVFQSAQGIVGCLIARSITAAILASILHDWPAMLVVVVTTILSAGLVAWTIGRYGTLSGRVAAWGAMPGGASAMVALSEEFGADPRLVAFMQYVRVVCVVVTASLVARLVLGDGHAGGALAADAHPPDLAVSLLPIAETLALALGGGWVGRRLNIPAGGLMVPMVVGAVLHASGVLDITIPQPVLAAAYALIGWYVGLRFTRATLAHAIRSLPEVLIGSFATIILAAVSGWLLVILRHTDPLTAFLATSPGGIDSVAIIAVGSDVDVGFVMALQTVRVLLVLFTGPALARWVARFSDAA